MTDSEELLVPPVASPPDSLGQALRNARLEHDLTLEQLATELRIEAKHLNALEEDRFEQIGVPVFVKGYLKQYGQRLGLDPRDLLALYYKQTTLADVEIQPNRTIKLRDERQVTSWILAVVVLLAVIAGLAVWWWNGGTLTLPTSAPPPAEAGSERAVEQAAIPLPRTAPAPIENAGPSPAQPTPPGDAASEPARAAVEAAAPRDEERAAPVVAIPLELTFDRESWVEVTDSRGERLLFGLTAAGREVTVRGEPPFAVVLGDADAVRLSVAGEPYAIPTTGRQGNLARFSVDIAEE
jgi:cytoskeleton protein RodZ